MSIRGDSYSSTSEVLAFTRHLLDGQTAFNSTTRPTATELEKFIDRASGYLNLAMEGSGLATPITNSTAKLACDDWVTERAAEHVELTQRGVGFSDQEGSRVYGFRNMHKSAMAFVRENRAGFIALGVSTAFGLGRGVVFTGEKATAERDDRSDNSLRQPMFSRGQFDDPSLSLDSNQTS